MEAMGVAYQQCESLCLNIAGDGSQRQKIAARAKALNVASRYRYHGVYTHPEERCAFMRSLDVFVMPSFTEGTPNSIVEAMAHGIPIIASQVGGVPDMIGDDAGLLVPPGDVGALEQAMLRLARDQDPASIDGARGLRTLSTILFTARRAAVDAGNLSKGKRQRTLRRAALRQRPSSSMG